MRILPGRLVSLAPLLLPAMFLACKEDKEPPPLALDDTGVDCSANPPVVTSVTAGNGGLQNFEGTDYYTFAITTAVQDQDLDLDRVAVDIWWDLTVDGHVDTSGAPNIDGKTTVTRDLPCGVASATFTHYVPMKSGGELPFDTQVEVGAIGYDSHGVGSVEALVGSGWTPNEDGTDGGS